MRYFLKLIFGIKLHVSDSFSVHHQEFFTVHTAVVYNTGLLTACEQDQEVLMMDRGTVRNMWIFIPKINLRNFCI
jgi:hypothetical protein